MEMTCDDVINILNSITKISVENGELEVWLDDGDVPMTAVEFVPGSFYRQLLVLIESNLITNERIG